MLTERLPGLMAVYQFGSTVPGSGNRETPESDVDLAVLASRPIASEARMQLKIDLGALLGRDVDLVDLRTADSVITTQVLGSGLLIHDASPREVALFETTALSKYCTLNEERREILEDIKKRGRIYAR